MPLNIGIVMDPITGINYKKDSSLAMLTAAQKRGWTLHYMEQSDLFMQNGQACAVMRPLSVRMDPNDWYTLGDAQQKPLSDLDCVLMRKDPPFDNEFIYSTYLLEQAESCGTLIVNKPQSLRDCNEKLFATQFADCMVPTLVSRRADLLKAFAQEHQDVIYKPLDGMGGASVFHYRVGHPNLGVILETLTRHGQEQIMAQRYIPEIKQGDKRILMINGEPVPYCLARIPAEGETRGNLAAGGTGVGQPLSDTDRAIAEKIGPTLREKGLLFVGLDIIGTYLTEINVTSPTCIRELDKQFDLDIAGQLMDQIEETLKTRANS